MLSWSKTHILHLRILKCSHLKLWVSCLAQGHLSYWGWKRALFIYSTPHTFSLEFSLLFLRFAALLTKVKSRPTDPSVTESRQHSKTAELITGADGLIGTGSHRSAATCWPRTPFQFRIPKHTHMLLILFLEGNVHAEMLIDSTSYWCNTLYVVHWEQSVPYHQVRKRELYWFL